MAFQDNVSDDHQPTYRNGDTLDYLQELTRQLMEQGICTKDRIIFREDEGLQAMDQILRDEDVATPTSSNLFVGDQPTTTTTSCVDINCEPRAARTSTSIANQLAYKHVEPSDDPFTDEIPWSDLVFWLGNAATGQVECPCPPCLVQRRHGRVALVGPDHHIHTRAYVPRSLYKHLSAKIPLVEVPRIEGVN